MPKISISYRRSDSEAITGRIFDRLTAHYGKDAIFRDIDDIPPGIDFRQHINETLLKTSILLAIVGPEWLGRGASGNERINEESDPVRVEVEMALRRRVPLIPVLIGATRMPSSEQLPPSLKDFAFRNAVKVDTGQDFDYHMDRLVKAMDSILGQKPTSSPPSRETPIPTSGRSAAATATTTQTTETPRKQDTGRRQAPLAFVSDLSAADKKKAGPSVSLAWLEALWPASRSGRIIRLAVLAAIAIPFGLMASGVLTGGSGGRGRLLTLAGHSGPVNAVTFSPDARTIVSGSADKSVKIWDAASGKLLKTLAADSDSVSSVAYLPSGKRLASGSWDRSIVIWDADTWQPIRTLRFDQTYSWEVPPAVWAIAVSPDGVRVASGSADSTVKIWNDATGELLRTLRGHNDTVESVAFTPDGKQIVSGSKDGTVRIWDLEAGRDARVLRAAATPVSSIAVSPDGRQIATAAGGNSVTIWSVGSSQLIRTIAAGSTIIDSVSFSPDSRRIVTGGRDGLVEIWSAASGQLVRALPGHSGSIRAVAYAPDGHRLVSGGDDKTVDVWAAD